MLGLKLNHVSKRGYWQHYTWADECRYTIVRRPCHTSQPLPQISVHGMKHPIIQILKAFGMWIPGCDQSFNSSHVCFIYIWTILFGSALPLMAILSCYIFSCILGTVPWPADGHRKVTSIWFLPELKWFHQSACRKGYQHFVNLLILAVQFHAFMLPNKVKAFSFSKPDYFSTWGTFLVVEDRQFALKFQAVGPIPLWIRVSQAGFFKQAFIACLARCIRFSRIVTFEIISAQSWASMEFVFSISTLWSKSVSTLAFMVPRHVLWKCIFSSGISISLNSRTTR